MRYFLPETSYKPRPHTDFIAIHCSATMPRHNFGVGACRRYHTRPKPHGRGWMDIGYHFYIERSGTVYVGRPYWAVGAHVRGFNDRAIGVCYEGGTSATGEPEDNITPAQRGSLSTIVTLLTALYPSAIVQGHRNFPGVEKACPSFDAEAWWARVVAPR